MTYSTHLIHLEPSDTLTVERNDTGLIVAATVSDTDGATVARSTDVTQARALKRAREIADARGLPLPNGLDEVAGEVLDALVADLGLTIPAGDPRNRKMWAHVADAWPDVVVACTGGGSNFAGIAFPFIGQQLRGKGKTKQRRIVAVEPAACPSLTRGKYAYDFGDTGHMTPLSKMHTLGSGFTPPGLHAGGLRYHGMAPLVSHCRELGLLEVLLQRAGRLVSKDQLVERLCEWGEEVSNNAIEVYIHRLRKKIEQGPVRIATVRGLGYCLEKIAA